MSSTLMVSVPQGAAGVGRRESDGVLAAAVGTAAAGVSAPEVEAGHSIRPRRVFRRHERADVEAGFWAPLWMLAGVGLLAAVMMAQGVM